VIRSMSTAERAMIMEQTRIDALANNLANVDTTGFRQVLTRVTEPDKEPGRINDGPAVSQATGTRTPAGSQTGSTDWAPMSRLDMYHALDNRPGPMVPTGRDTDVAVMGDGFFEIQTEDGPRYTRSGSFVLDSQGRLTTPEGRPVMGESGPLTIDGESFTIATDGTVNVDGQTIGRLKLVDFPDPSRLEHLGGSLMNAPLDLPPRTLTAEETTLAQGHVERSNVDPVTTLVAMIEAQRAFDIQSKVVMTEDEMLTKSVNNLPRINA
jgi:flagellar basal-body rod protein FlgF